MSKRKNPFGEVSPLQRKMHIGTRSNVTSFSSTIDQELQRKHDRTLEMLVRGSKNYERMLACNNSDENSALSLPLSRTSVALEGQLQLNNQLMRIIPPFTVSESLTTCLGCRNISVPALQQSCCHCSSKLCSNDLCANSVRQCWQCASVFCSNCTTLNYKESIDRSFCLQCAELQRS